MIIILKGSNSIPDFGEVSPKEMSSLDDSEITLRRKDTDGFASSFSKDIEFYGGAFNYIKKYLITDTKARINYLIMEVYDDCCKPLKLIYRGKITANTIDYCLRNDYSDVACSVNTSTEELDSVALVRKSLISKNNKWDDGVLFWDRIHAQIPYCEEIRPASMHFFRFFLGLYLTLFFFSIFPILAAISAIIGIINAFSALFGGRKVEWSDITGPFNSIRSFFFEDIPRWSIGCGYNHYMVKVRDYIENAIQGYDNTIVFSSSIFNNPNSIYNDTFLLISPTHEGEYTYFQQNGQIDNNLVNLYATRDSPNWTLGELLDKLKTVFNAEWWIEGKIIYFEYKKGYKTPEIWIDLNKIEKERIENICLKWEDAPNYLGARFQVQNDGFDSCSDEAKYLYNDIVQYNPLTPSQGKLLDIQFPFAPARFRDDGLGTDAVDFFSSVFSIYQFIGLSRSDLNFDKNLLLSSGKVSVCKLLIPESGYDNKRVIVINKNGAEGFNFNYPYWVDAAHPLYNPAGYYDNPPNSKKRREGENLFQFFLETDPHNVSGETAKIGQSFEISLDGDCSIYNGMFDTEGKIKNNLKIKLEIDKKVHIGTVNEVSISNNKFKINGIL